MSPQRYLHMSTYLRLIFSKFPWDLSSAYFQPFDISCHLQDKIINDTASFLFPLQCFQGDSCNSALCHGYHFCRHIRDFQTTPVVYVKALTRYFCLLASYKFFSHCIVYSQWITPADASEGWISTSHCLSCQILPRFRMQTRLSARIFVILRWKSSQRRLPKTHYSQVDELSLSFSMMCWAGQWRKDFRHSHESIAVYQKHCKIHCQDCSSEQRPPAATTDF